MAKFLNDSIINLALAGLEAADQYVICAGQPATYANATTDAPTGNALGEVAIDNTDFTQADGDVSGRKTTVAAQSAIDIDVSDDADHIAIVDDGTSALLLVTTTPTQAVTQGNTADTAAFDFEIQDPS